MIPEVNCEEKTNLCMPLGMASAGTTFTVEEIHGGRKLRSRLMELGLNIGGKVQMLKNDMSGPLILAVKENGRIALGRGMAFRIYVKQIN